MSILEHKFITIDEAASALANDIASTLSEAIALRGNALLALSGGKTPELVFKYLITKKLEWHKITITLTDERWVTANHSDSNENLIRSHLFNKLSEAPTFVPLFEGNETLEKDVKSCESRLKNLNFPFDVVYIGMGTDGHFASLFPGENSIEITKSKCVGVVGNDTRLPRISLTASTILSSRKIFLLFSGKEKNIVYNNAKASGSYKDLPLRLILLQDKIPVEVFYAP